MSWQSWSTTGESEITDPVYALRLWRVRRHLKKIPLQSVVERSHRGPFAGDEGWYLTGAAWEYVWRGPVVTVTPNEKVACDTPYGFWGLKSDHFAKHLHPFHAQAAGIVELNGKIVEGTWGYRAQQATVCSIVLFKSESSDYECCCPLCCSDAIPKSYELANVAPDLGNRYQCDVAIMDANGRMPSADIIARLRKELEHLTVGADQ